MPSRGPDDRRRDQARTTTTWRPLASSRARRPYAFVARHNTHHSPLRRCEHLNHHARPPPPLAPRRHRALFELRLHGEPRRHRGGCARARPRAPLRASTRRRNAGLRALPRRARVGGVRLGRRARRAPRRELLRLGDACARDGARLPLRDRVGRRRADLLPLDPRGAAAELLESTGAVSRLRHGARGHHAGAPLHPRRRQREAVYYYSTSTETPPDFHDGGVVFHAFAEPPPVGAAAVAADEPQACHPVTNRCDEGICCDMANLGGINDPTPHPPRYRCVGGSACPAALP